MKIRRRLNKSEVQKVYQSGKCLKGTFLILRYAFGKGRWCFMTPRKLGTHALRNYHKRRLREVVRGAGFLFNEWDILLGALSTIHKATFQDIQEDYVKLLTQLQKIQQDTTP